MKWRSVGSRCFTSLVAVIVLGCDPFQQDFIRPENEFYVNPVAEYYSLSGSPTLIDVKAMLSSLSQDVTIRILEEPGKGTLTTMEELVFKYTPAASFMNGSDQFKLLFTGKSKVVTQVITIYTSAGADNLPCGLYAVEDYSYTTMGTSVSIKALSNDYICGVGPGDVEVQVVAEPLYGEVEVSGDSIIYIPAANFLGTDEVIYSIKSIQPTPVQTPESTQVSHGVITINVSDGECPFSIVKSLTLNLVDAEEDPMNVGDCAGGYDIRLWHIEEPPCDHYGYFIRLLNATNNSGTICYGRRGEVAYYPDALRAPQNEVAEFEVCVNAQCEKVTIHVIRE